MALAKRNPAGTPSKQVEEIQEKHILGLSKSPGCCFNSLWQEVKLPGYRQKVHLWPESWLKTRNQG